MESLLSTGMGTDLAVDILFEHFGDSAAHVGRVLLERGQLSLPEILRFVNQRFGSAVEDLGFKQCRNALLILVRHRIAVPRNSNAAQDDSGAKGMVYAKYSIDVEEVLARLRFPHYLENMWYFHGKLAHELLFVVLKYGCASSRFAKEEALKVNPDRAESEVAADFQKLVTLGVLRAVEPLIPFEQSGGSSASNATAGPESKSNGTADERPAKQPRLDGANGNGGASTTNFSAVIYTYSRANLNLAVYKSTVVRIVEERRNPKTAQVVNALLEFVKVTENGSVSSDWKNFGNIESKMHETGAHKEGRDPVRERDELRKVLDSLSVNQSGLVKVRRVKTSAHAVRSQDAGNGDDEPPNQLKRSRPSVLAAQLRGEMGEIPEWCLSWKEAKKLVVGATTSQLVRDQFGAIGFRIYNQLCEKTPPQKLDEKEIFQSCMVPQPEGREILNSMVRRGILRWQEVPRSASSPLIHSFWLYYVDLHRVNAVLLQTALKMILSLRVRFRVQNAKMLPLESRASSGGLTPQDRTKLRVGRVHEDILERSWLTMDMAIMAYSCF